MRYFIEFFKKLFSIIASVGKYHHKNGDSTPKEIPEATSHELSNILKSSEIGKGENMSIGKPASFGRFVEYDTGTVEQASKYFTMPQLTVTSQPVNNTPNDTEKAKLRKLGELLDLIHENIGPFKIESAFRSEALQQHLRNLGYPTSQGKSYHELGIAADLVPTTMSLDEFFGRIAAFMKNHVGELAIKKSQGAVHVSLPTLTKTGFVMYMDDAGRYIKMSADQLKQYISPYVEQAIAEVKKNPLIVLLPFIAIGAWLSKDYFLKK